MEPIVQKTQLSVHHILDIQMLMADMAHRRFPTSRNHFKLVIYVLRCLVSSLMDSVGKNMYSLLPLEKAPQQS